MEILDQTRPRACPSDMTRRLFRALFFVTTIAGGVLFWLAPHPPMDDLPQHAAQVAALHDLLLGQSTWDQLLRINLFTPYLLAYGLATALSFLMPVGAALKLVLTLSFYGFVAIHVTLRRRFHADERLDWLCVPGFFGFAYEYGFFSYLVATPIGMGFLLIALDYAEQPSCRRGAVLLLADIAVFFSHGLLFVFVNAIGGTFLLVRNHGDWRRIVRSVWPYIVLAALCGAYALSHHDVDLAPMYPFTVLWSLNPLIRFLCAIAYPWGIAPSVWMLAATMLMFAAPFCIGARWSRNGMALVPLAIFALGWFCIPAFAMNTNFLFHRFALFLLPFYALNFSSAECDDETRGDARRLGVWTQIALAAVCAAFLGAQGVRAMRFADESADFDTIAAEVEPAQRALNVAFNINSPAANNPVVYDNFALWYQADHRGLVDFNAAWFPPQIVRYRLDRLPAVGPADVAPKPLSARFDWYRHQGWVYRYFFVRHTSPIPVGFFANPDCPVVLVKTVGTWSVYERQACRRG
ncbi:UNVERIFIED_ORG: hypothetical protein ABIC54_006064 [Burkholderia sp. 1263]